MMQTIVKTRVGPIHRNVVLVTCFIGYLMYALDRSLMPPVFSLMMDDLHLQYAQQGILFSSFFVGFAVLPFVAGSLSDRFGRARMMFVGLLVFSVGTFLTGAASGLADCIVWRVLTGIGEGIFWAPTVALLSGLFRDIRGRAIGIMQAAYPLGFFIGTATAGVLAEATRSWRGPFYLSGIASMLVAAGVFLLVAESPREQTTAVGEKLSPWHVFRERNVVIAAIALFIAFWGTWALNAWLPTFFAKERGLSITMAAMVTGLFGLSGALGYVVCGALSDRIGRKTMLVFGSLGCGLVGFLILQLTSVPLLILTVLIGAILGGAIVPVILALTGDAVPPELAGAATGLVTNVGALSGIVSPVLAASMAETSSLHDALIWNYVGPMLLVGLVALLLQSGPLKRDHEPA